MGPSPMIDPAFVATMARYNKWQNDSLFAAADGIGDAARRLDRGAFFGSIHGTLSHLLWGDRIWMHRFDGLAKPEVPIARSAEYAENWEELKSVRAETDAAILDWSARVSADWLAETLSWYSGALGREMTSTRALLVTHFFNHQTHHRGQVHAMLTAAGARPDDTDLMAMA